MRSLEYADEKDIAEIMAQPWQLELLKMNPEYTSWGPHEDYMWVKGEEQRLKNLFKPIHIVLTKITKLSKLIKLK